MSFNFRQQREHPPCFRGEQVSDQLSQIKKGDIQVSESIEPLLRFEIEQIFENESKFRFFCSEGGVLSGADLPPSRVDLALNPLRPRPL